MGAMKCWSANVVRNDLGVLLGAGNEPVGLSSVAVNPSKVDGLTDGYASKKAAQVQGASEVVAEALNNVRAYGVVQEVFNGHCDALDGMGIDAGKALLAGFWAGVPLVNGKRPKARDLDEESGRFYARLRVMVSRWKEESGKGDGKGADESKGIAIVVLNRKGERKDSVEAIATSLIDGLSTEEIDAIVAILTA
jgi:hypothetical protein